MYKAKFLRILAIFFIAIFFLSANVSYQKAHAASPELVVFAAASTSNAITEIGALYASKGLGTIKTSFASSSTLAKQIENGAPADVFLSANIEWADYLAEKNLLAQNSLTSLLTNRIVLIVPQASPIKEIDIKKDVALLPLLGTDGRLAVGDPEHVPVGKYGKQALENLGVWDLIKDRIAPTKDVRAGLTLVEQGEVPLGLVYESDASVSNKVRIVGTFPENSHPTIIYPVVVVEGKNVVAALEFIKFLLTPEAQVIFKKYGFERL